MVSGRANNQIITCRKPQILEQSRSVAGNVKVQFRLSIKYQLIVGVSRFSIIYLKLIFLQVNSLASHQIQIFNLQFLAWNKNIFTNNSYDYHFKNELNLNNELVFYHDISVLIWRLIWFIKEIQKNWKYCKGHCKTFHKEL